MHGSQMTRITNHKCTESNHVHLKESLPLILATMIEFEKIINIRHNLLRDSKQLTVQGKRAFVYSLRVDFVIINCIMCHIINIFTLLNY